MTAMRTFTAAAGALLGLALMAAPAQAHWSVGIRLGVPVYYRPWGPYYYYPYPPVYYAPPPVVVQPAPVFVQPAPLSQPVYPTPALAPAAAHTTAQDARQAEVDRHLQLLADADERVRAESVMQLGRLRAARAVDPLAATLAGDRSPLVRESAAKALGLIGSPKALPALQQAAVADNDRDVRHSAQFAIEVVRTAR